MNSLRERLERDSIPEPNSGCLLWLGATMENGYGIMRWRGHNGLVHRLSWADANQKAVPPGLCVCHKCDVPSCINPAHLFVGTQRENLQDMTRKGRRRSGYSSMPGERNPACKVSEASVSQIRIATGTCKQIGLRFGLSPQHISKIKRGDRRAAA